MISRRAFLTRAAAGAGALSLGIRSAGAQQRGDTAQAPGAPGALDTSNLFAMDQLASRPVRLPPRPGAKASMTPAQRDELEHRIKCQCGCTLDVYTCRTTDFSCQVSPAMHRDVMYLVEGGYSAQEIIDAFVNVYGERALMSPPKEGFNLFGYAAPFIALGVGGIVVFTLIRQWHTRSRVVSSAVKNGADPRTDATPEELARIEAAVREDE